MKNAGACFLTGIMLILPPAVSASVAMPVLKWQHGGCTSWCETGWYSSPAVADVDGDGQPEVIGSGYAIHVLNGTDGSLEWRVKSGHDRSEGEGVNNVGRTWPGIVIADIDGDGQQDIAAAHGGGWVSVYNGQGYFKPGWPKRPIDGELRGLSVSDLDADGSMEVIVNGALGSKTNTWVYEHNGVLRTGWPQLGNDSGSAWGVFNDNTAVGDLDGDGYGEVIVPSDVHFICAYEEDGIQIPTNAVYSGKNWGGVGVWEDLNTELRGWGRCNGVRSESYRANFAKGPAVIADMDENGINEVIAIGNMYECTAGYQSKYETPFIFNADRSRFKTANSDWERAPVDTGSPLVEDYNIIESNQPNPVTADLDGDGEKEILFPSYDGRLHAYWLDKREHGNWPYEVDAHASEGFYRFASEPTVADLDNDGRAEVIFASWVEKGSNSTGKLHIVDYQGNRLREIDLPPAKGSSSWNGALAAPTLANIDADADLEVILNTAHSGLVAYDLPGTENASIIWSTGRGSYRRDGYVATAPAGTSCGVGPVELDPASFGEASVYQSESSLTTSGNIVVKTGLSITFEASTEIDLQPGFKVEKDALFRARIRMVKCF